MSIVAVLGAGATKACGGPMTDEIMPIAFLRREELAAEPLSLLRCFLLTTFGVSKETLDRVAASPGEIDEIVRRCKHEYPGLPLLLSLLDTAILRNGAFGPAWPASDLRSVRASIEAVVFEVIELMLRDAKPLHARLLDKLGPSPTIISLNYDLLADYALMQQGVGCFPDYGIDIDTEAYGKPRNEAGDDNQGKAGGTLLKIHGSLNWLYCPGCHRVDVGLTAGAPASLLKMNDVLRMSADADVPCAAHLADGACGTRMQHVLITPSHRKDYRNPHIGRLWLRAENALREARQVVFIGYSLPWDDVEVIYLLMRGVAHLKAGDISVVSRGGPIHEHDAGKRYRAIFGDVNWHASANGFEDWLDG